MDPFADRISRLADLGDDELAQLEQEMVAAFDQADQAGDVETMSSIADGLDEVRAESQRRQAGTPDAGAPAPAAAAPAVAAAAESTDAETGDEGSEDAVEAVAETEETVEETAPEAEAADETAAEESEDAPAPADEATAEVETPEVEAEATAEDAEPAATDEAEPVDPETEAEEAPAAEVEDTTESVEGDTTTESDESSSDDPPAAEAADDSQEENMDVELTADDAPAEAAPEEALAASAAPVSVIRAGGDIPNVPAGAVLSDMDEVANALTERINTLRNSTGGNGEQLLVASIQADPEQMSEERTLHIGDTVGNSQKIAASMDPEALTAAANGWCAPRTPIYNIFGVGTTDRPVRDSLNGFNADRGGVVFSTPPKLSDGSFGTGTWVWNGTGWKGHTDGAGAGNLATKVLVSVDCSAEITADLDVITAQLKFTNMLNRAYPEYIKRNMELSLIAQARLAESKLLYTMWGLTNKVAENPSIPLGAVRDALHMIRATTASYRNRHRMSPAARFDAWAPAWLRDAIAQDLSDQMPGDDKLVVAYAEIDGYIRDAGVDMTWFLDDVPGQSQTFADDHTMPTNACIIIAPPGNFLYLDGGSLNLGVVRDGDLVGTNEYIEFTESFENVTQVGVESLGITLPVFVSGTTALGKDTSAGVAIT